MTRKVGKLNANKPIGTEVDQRPHGTRWKTGARGVLTPDNVREYASLGMSLPAIGYLLGCTKQNIYQAIKDDPELNQAWNEGTADLNYAAGKCVRYNIDNNNLVAGMFTLKAKPVGGDNGWVEEQFNKKIESDSIQKVMIYLPDNNRDPQNNDDSFSVNDG